MMIKNIIWNLEFGIARPPGPGPSLREHVLYGLGSRLGEGDGSSANHVMLLVVDAQGPVDGGEQLGGTNFAVDDRPAVRVGLAVDGSAADARAGERGAPCRGEVVAAQAGVDLGGTAEFGERDHQGVLE